MCHKPLIILLSLISLNSVQSFAFNFPTNCGPEEVSVRCTPSNQPTCSSPEGSGSLICDGHCICKEDYLRDKEGKCIPMKNCPKVCSENSVFEKCTQKYKQRCVKRETQDDRLNACIPGCTCKRGYYWSENMDSCLKKQECLIAERLKTIPRFGRSPSY